MCLIVAKPKGYKIPKSKKMRRWFALHPDGFGLAFVHQDRVRILKGAMDIKGMDALISEMRMYLHKTDPKDIDMLFHFRQATEGMIAPQNCHPFPVTYDQEEMGSLDLLTDCALVHNGIIWDYYKRSGYGLCSDKTDTQEFIEDYLAGLGGSLWNHSVQKIIRDYTESKFALLTKHGITYIGDFISEAGYWYSNGGFKSSPCVVRHYGNVTTYTRANTKYWGNQDEEADEGTPSYSSGLRCALCNIQTPFLYALPEDEDSEVCSECFTYYTGELPSRVHIATWHGGEETP